MKRAFFLVIFLLIAVVQHALLNRDAGTYQIDLFDVQEVVEGIGINEASEEKEELNSIKNIFPAERRCDVYYISYRITRYYFFLFPPQPDPPELVS